MSVCDIRSLSEEELRALMSDWGQPSFRAAQIQSWLDNGCTSFSQMRNLPAPLRERLGDRYSIPGAAIRRKLVSKLDGTVKYLFEFVDGECVESVLMQYQHGWSQCLSTQAGCRMGCVFCATGMGGFARNLTPSEMLAQITAAQEDHGVRVSSVVLMGMGEPLDNYENVLCFLKLLGRPGGVQIGLRHVSLSTCGLVDGIRRLMDERLQLTLSVSLHAPNNAIRSRLMPVNRRYPVEELLAACREYGDVTGRRVSYEYALIGGVNDSDGCAEELAGRLRGSLCHVNVIPANEVEGSGMRRSTRERQRAFCSILSKRGINVTVRRTLGADILASCGQLRGRDREETSTAERGIQR